jgi:hypothetical protein
LGYFLAIYNPLFQDDNPNTQFNAAQKIKAVSEAKKYGMNFRKDFASLLKM